MSNQDPSSRKVIIKRKIAIGDHNQKEIEEMMGSSSRPIGSYWDGKSKKAGSGLTFPEQSIIMPYIINSISTDRDFRLKCEDYFNEIDTKVPKEGVELEVGLYNNDEPVSETNLPLAPVDYVAYRHAIGHPQVAKSKEEAKNPLVKWYIEDPEAELDREKKSIEFKDKALQLYLANKDDKKVVNMVLDLVGIKVIDAKKLGEFKKLSETNPTQFEKLITDKDVKLRHLITLAISEGILVRVGHNILWKESGESIGASMEEVVVNLKDKAKTPELNRIKAALKSYQD